MKIPIFQVDAFTEKLFGGNPAAVCPLTCFTSDEILQNIALENNLAETAFFVQDGDDFNLRWFTPAIEVDLCGHATLATAHVLWNHLNYSKEEIHFNTRSGILKVIRITNSEYLMDFPSDNPIRVLEKQIINIVQSGLKAEIKELYKGKDDYMAILNSERDVINLEPDFRTIATLPSRGLIASSPGSISDFVSRCFYPQSGIDEDPATGSAHTLLTPYWSMNLRKNKMTAFQLSSRKGKLKCIYKGNRTAILGHAITFLQGEIQI